MSVVHSALALAARGWPVFPCRDTDKAPLTPASNPKGARNGGLYLATTDRAAVAAFWKQHPRAMIGLRTGVASGFWVLDLDPKQNTAEELLAAVTAFCGGSVAAADPETGETSLPPMVRTQSGGYHLYFALPLDEKGDAIPLGNRAGLFRKTDADPILHDVCETRGDGGYVIAPPSVMRNGNRYEWIARDGKTPPPQACARLLDLVLRRGEFDRSRMRDAEQGELQPQSGEAPQGSISERAQAGVMRPEAKNDRPAAKASTRLAGESVEDHAVRLYAEAALDGEIKILLGTTKGRNDALNVAAVRLGGLVGAGVLSESMVSSALEQAAHGNGYVQKDGLGSARATIQSGLEAGRHSPRDLSEVRATARRRADARNGRSSAAPSHSASDPPQAVSPGLPEAPENENRAGAGAAKEPGGGGQGGAGGDGDDPRLDFELSLEPATDMGNANRFIRRHGRRFRHVREWGWLWYDGKRWSREGAQGRLERAVQDTVRAIADEIEALEVRPEAQDTVRLVRGKAQSRILRLREWVLDSQSAGHVACIPGLALAELERRAKDFDRDLMTFNVQNGTLVFERVDGRPKARLRPHDPQDLITKISPVSYDPKAVCPRYDTFLIEVQPPPAGADDDLSMHRFLHQWAGLSLTGDTSEQKLVFLYGKGRNGKGVWVEAVAHVAGEYSQSTPIETFLDSGRSRRGGEASPELAELSGVRLLRTSEPKKGAKLDDGLIKLVTGGDAMRARFLNKDLFEIIPRFKLTMQGNYRPKISDNSESIWNRIQLVPFPVFFKKEDRDPKLLDKLKAEGSGVLNRLIEGLLDWMENGLLQPESVREATESYRSDSDPVGRFLEICTAPVIGKRVQSSALHALYCAWAKANGEFEYPAPSFTKVLLDRGLPKKKADVIWWLDIEQTKQVHDFIDDRGQPKRGADSQPIADVEIITSGMGVEYDDD
jgi:putative DNA primase/helicase